MASEEGVVSPLFHWISLSCLAALLGGGALCIHRLVIGPSAADRAIALDTLTMVFIGIICILCIQWSSTLYFDAVWILTLVGYLGSVAVARYLEKGKLF
jgi:multisubunit Na+/H+ antiporter MnhF subunit